MKTESIIPRGGLYMKQIGGDSIDPDSPLETTVYDVAAARKYPIEKTESYSVSTPGRDLRLPPWGPPPLWKWYPSVEYGTRTPGKVYTDNPLHGQLLSPRGADLGIWLDHEEVKQARMVLSTKRREQRDRDERKRIAACFRPGWRPSGLDVPMAIARRADQL